MKHFKNIFDIKDNSDDNNEYFPIQEQNNQSSNHKIKDNNSQFFCYKEIEYIIKKLKKKAPLPPRTWWGKQKSRN